MEDKKRYRRKLREPPHVQELVVTVGQEITTGIQEILGRVTAKPHMKMCGYKHHGFRGKFVASNEPSGKNKHFRVRIESPTKQHGS